MNKIFQIIAEQLDDIEPVDSDPTRGPMPTITTKPAQKAVAPATAPAEPNYATQPIYKGFIPTLFDSLLKTGAFGTGKIKPEEFEQLQDTAVRYQKDSGRLPLIRTSGITDQQLLKATARLGLKEIPLTDLQKASSGQFNIHSFTQGSKTNNIVLTIVVAGRKKAQSFAGAAGDLVLNRKDLTPVKLGLVGKKISGIYTDRASLATATKKSISTTITNKKLATALSELVDLALARGAGQLTPESLKYITPVIGSISQDFGEVLAPLALAQDGEDITFPSGNEKLIDVTVGGKTRYSVKALGGSGTSMNSLGSLLDDYEATLTDEGKKKLFNDGIKIWRSTRKEGSVTDRIALAAKLNGIPEYFSCVDILGDEFDSFAKLKTLLKPLVEKLDYPNFLKTILPITQAGRWGYDVGMPDDYRYYLGMTDKKPEPGQAGKNSYDHNPVDAAANIITYCLGMGMRNLMTRGPDKDRYKEIMNDMIKQLNCQLGHVSIDPSGQLIISSKPFGNLDFEFDYHAPSHIAGNNRPGFMIVPPSKKKKVKESNDRNRQIILSPMRQRRD